MGIWVWGIRFELETRQRGINTALCNRGQVLRGLSSFPLHARSVIKTPLISIGEKLRICINVNKTAAPTWQGIESVSFVWKVSISKEIVGNDATAIKTVQKRTFWNIIEFGCSCGFWCSWRPWSVAGLRHTMGACSPSRTPASESLQSGFPCFHCTAWNVADMLPSSPLREPFLSGQVTFGFPQLFAAILCPQNCLASQQSSGLALFFKTSTSKDGVVYS